MKEQKRQAGAMRSLASTKGAPMAKKSKKQTAETSFSNSRRCGLYLPVELIKRGRREALDRNTSFSRLVIQALEQFLGKE